MSTRRIKTDLEEDQAEHIERLLRENARWEDYALRLRREREDLRRLWLAEVRRPACDPSPF